MSPPNMNEKQVNNLLNAKLTWSVYRLISFVM